MADASQSGSGGEDPLVDELARVRRRGLDVLALEPLIERGELPQLLGLAGADEPSLSAQAKAGRVAALVAAGCGRVADEPLRALAQALFRLDPQTRNLSPAAAREFAMARCGVGERQFRRTREPSILAAVAAGLRQTAEGGETDLLRRVRSQQLLDNPTLLFRRLSVANTLRFASGRVPVGSETVTRVRCLRDNLDTYVVEVQYTGDSPLALSVTGGGQFVRELEPSLSGYRRFEVSLRRWLHAGDEHTLEYRFAVAPGSSPPKPYYTITVDTPIPQASVRVAFAADAVPLRVSRVVSVFSSFPVPAEPLRAVAIDRRRVAEQTFEDLREGYRYGLIWEW